MSVAGLAVGLAVAFAALAVVLNHCYARLAVVELTLNEGLPPGYAVQTAATSARLAPPALSTEQVAAQLDAGVHIFLSRNCLACQRLVDELEQVDLEVDAPLFLRYVDRPRPIAKTAADRQGAALTEHDSELAQHVAADPLPYTIAVGQHGLLGRSVTPTISAMLATARDGGVKAVTRQAGS